MHMMPSAKAPLRHLLVTTITASAALVAFTVRARAAEQPLSLMQAIQQAVSNNADLRRERIAIDVADAQLESARGAFDFQLTSNLTFSRRTTPPLNSQDVQGGFTNNLVL